MKTKEKTELRYRGGTGMGDTTKMYIEHITIGMQTTLLMIFVFICFEPSLKSELKNISSVMELVIVIPIAYAMGILVDRISKYLLNSEKMEEKIKYKACRMVIKESIRNGAGCKNGKGCKTCKFNMISRVVWKKVDEMDYYNDARTRKRILRATFFNSVCAIVIITSLFISNNIVCTEKVSFALIICLLIIAIGCLWGYVKFMIDYYKKQKRYILMLNNNQK